MLLRGVAAPLAASFDRLVSRAITGRSSSARRRSRAEALGHAERVRALEAIERVYAGVALDDVDGFFGAPAAASPRLSTVGTLATARGKAKVMDARWRSRVAPFCTDIADRFEATRENHEASARLYLGEGSGRPAAILIHGYRGGHHGFEERVWPIRWLLDHGVDVAMFVLPFHGCRAQPGSPPRFPSSDPRFTNEAFRQAIDDLRALIRYLEARGARAVGAMGMSLGGFTASLLATVEERLRFVVPVIPLCSFADVAMAAGRFVGSDDEQRMQHALLERAHNVVSPLARPSRVPGAAAVVVAGEADRITPIAHARRIAAHMGADLVSFPGGHLLQFGRADGFRAVGRMLHAQGIFTNAPA
jgi:pimeloyl-ACP methyl ester carboxylesterase